MTSFLSLSPQPFRKSFSAYERSSVNKLRRTLRSRYHVPSRYLDMLASNHLRGLCELKYAVTHKTGYMRRHEYDVFRLVHRIGPSLGLDAEIVDDLGLVALFHDVGKSVVGHEELIKIISTKDRLNDEIFALIKQHAHFSGEIFSAYPILRKYVSVVRHHHERWDGKGYPDSLKGEEIPYLSRIISILDSYQAMITDRTYKPKKTKRQAFQEILDNAGFQFDPEIAFKVVEILGGSKIVKKFQESNLISRSKELI